MAKTKREMFVKLLTIDAVANDPEMASFVDYLIVQLDCRKGGKKNPNKKQTENIGIKNLICEVLGESETPMRVKDLTEDERLSEYSSSKITALLRQMLPEIGDGRVVRTLEKKVAYFTLA